MICLEFGFKGYKRKELKPRNKIRQSPKGGGRCPYKTEKKGRENKGPNKSACKCNKNKSAKIKSRHVEYLGAARVLEMIITTTCSIHEKGTYNAKNHAASIHVHHMARHIPKVSIYLAP